MRIINLLPTDEQQLLRQEKILHNIKRFIICSVASYVLLAAVLFVFRTELLSNLNSLSQQIQKAQDIISKQDSESLKKKINDQNNLVSDYLNLHGQTPQWSGVLEEFAKVVPQGIIVQTLTANQKTGIISITGNGSTRDAVLLLRSNILASKDFTNVDLPFDNIQTPVDVPFHYTFNLRDNVLVPKQP